MQGYLSLDQVAQSHIHTSGISPVFKFGQSLKTGNVLTALQILTSDMRVETCWVLTELHRVSSLKKESLWSYLRCVHSKHGNDVWKYNSCLIRKHLENTCNYFNYVERYVGPKYIPLFSCYVLYGVLAIFQLEPSSLALHILSILLERLLKSKNYAC